MANIDFIRGQLSKIDERPVNDGNILLATNTGQLFIDAGGSRISISSVVIVDTLPESTQAKQDILYYAKDTNYLHHYNGNNFDIVNIPSTGGVGQVLKKTLDGIEFGLAEHIAEKQTQKPISFQVTGIDGEDFTIEFTEESGSDTPVNADMLGGKPASDYVTKNITINEKPLSGDITLNAADVGALPVQYAPKKFTISLEASGWQSNQKTITVEGITTENIVLLSPASKADADAWTAAGVWCTGQGANSLTFSCESVPSSAIGLNLMILEAAT